MKGKMKNIENLIVPSITLHMSVMVNWCKTGVNYTKLYGNEIRKLLVCKAFMIPHHLFLLILSHIREYGFVKAKEAAVILRVSDTSIHVLLQDMVDRKLLVKKGVTNGVKYYLPEK